MEEDNGSQQPISGAVECDPNKRYWRFEDFLGRGAFKTVFKAFDSREGTEVAWNKVQLGCAVNEDPCRKRLFSEIHVLKRLKHKNIMTFHDYWLDEKTNTLNFITELFTHGSLKKFRAKHKHLELRVLKKWAWQILQGLVYLHGHEPPIIHRDLKCDNILINGVTGDIKIGDLGLATLWKGLAAPLSVIGTPEFMAPEFYDEKYDEKVDVYAFGMLLLELVSMDYPYSECSNPAAIYKKVSQGVFPESIQKIRTEELRKFIELCIAYDPDQRPEARKLLKHPFFDDVRKNMEPDRHYSDDPDVDCGFCTSDRSGSPAHASQCLVETGATSSEMDSKSDREEEPPYKSMPNGVKIRIQCAKDEGEPKLNFTLRYDRPGGIPKDIQFPFDIECDTADDIVNEMLAAPIDSDIMITEEEACTIGQMIAREVEKWKVPDEVELKAYVNVTRAYEGPESVENITVGSFEAREALESKMDDIYQTVATDLTEDNVFRTLEENGRDMLDYYQAGSSRRSLQSKHMTEDDHLSESAMTSTSGMFFQQVGSPMAPSEMSRRYSGNQRHSTSALDIPIHRRSSETTAPLESSHSFSSSFSDIPAHSMESRQFQMRLSRRRTTSSRTFLSEGPSASLRANILRSISLTVENNSNPTESPLKSISPLASAVEFSFVVVDPSSETEASGNCGQERSVDNEFQDSRQGNNRSLISMVTMKPTTKKAEGYMPTVPEAPVTRSDSLTFKHTESHLENVASEARSKADEWQWSLARGIFNEPQSSSHSTNVPSTGASPQNSFRRMDSTGSTVDRGMKSSSLSQDVESCGRSEVNVSLTLPDGCEINPLGSAPPSIGLGPKIDDLKETEKALQDQALQGMQASTQMHIVPPSNHEAHKHVKSNEFADALDFRLPHSTLGNRDCRSVSEFGPFWGSHSIRAFRCDEESRQMVVAGPSFQMKTPWSEPHLSHEARLSVNRMFSSCVDLSSFAPEAQGLKNPLLFENKSSFEGSTKASTSEMLSNCSFHPMHHSIHSSIDYSLHSQKDVAGNRTSVSGNLDGMSSWIQFDDDTLASAVQKQQTAHFKELRRQKAEANIDKMQQQQLAKLCSSVGVGATNGKVNGKSQQFAMKASLNP